MERFLWSLKNEWTNHEPFADLESARLSAFKYAAARPGLGAESARAIETFHNPVRLHQTLGYQFPDQYEAVLAPATAA